MRHLKLFTENFTHNESTKAESKKESPLSYFPKGFINELPRAQKNLLEDQSSKTNQSTLTLVKKLEKAIEGDWKNKEFKSLIKGISIVKTESELKDMVEAMVDAINHLSDGSDATITELPKGFLALLPRAQKGLIEGNSEERIAKYVEDIDKLVDGKWRGADVKAEFRKISGIKTHSELLSYVRGVLRNLKELGK